MNTTPGVRSGILCSSSPPSGREPFLCATKADTYTGLLHNSTLIVMGERQRICSPECCQEKQKQKPRYSGPSSNIRDVDRVRMFGGVYIQSTTLNFTRVSTPPGSWCILHSIPCRTPSFANLCTTSRTIPVRLIMFILRSTAFGSGWGTKQDIRDRVVTRGSWRVRHVINAERRPHTIHSNMHAQPARTFRLSALLQGPDRIARSSCKGKRARGGRHRHERGRGVWTCARTSRPRASSQRRTDTRTKCQESTKIFSIQRTRLTR